MKLIYLCLCVLLVSACASLRPQQPDITLQNIKPLNLSLSGQRLAVTLKVSNPNAFDLALRSIDVTATLGDEPIATGNSDTAVTIPAGGEQTVTLEVLAGLDVAFARLRAAFESDQSGLDYGVTGTVRLADWPLPVDFESDGRLDNPLVAQ